MITGYVSQIRTSKATGDITLPVEVTREQLLYCVPLNLEKVVVMSEKEYVRFLDELEAARHTDVPIRLESKGYTMMDGILPTDVSSDIDPLK